MASLRTALYLRLDATPDPSRDEHEEFTRLRALTTREGWRIVHEYLDVAGGAADELHRLLADAHAGRFDLVLCPSLEQFAPGGLSAALRQLAQLRRYDVAFHSLGEPALSTVPGAEGSWPAALERSPPTRRGTAPGAFRPAYDAPGASASAPAGHASR